MQKSVTMTEKLQVEAVYQSDNTFISIKAPKQLDGISRTPTDIVCVIDISGSMGSEAKIHTDAGKAEGFGFTTLDLVKHALATIISSLGSEDRLALVSFNSQAKVELNLTVMDDTGKKKAMKASKALDADGSTNLWGGLKSGLDILKNSQAVKNSAILLLTDGQPNVEPPRGHGPSLLKYKEENGLPAHIHYFGFGYEMNSKLLNELAIIGNGAYSYIPDGSFVGTVFINALANLLTTVASKLTLKISLEKCEIDKKAPMLSLFNHKFSDKDLVIDIGTVGFGQDRDIVLPITLGDSKQLNVEIAYETMFNEDPITLSQEIFVDETKSPITINQISRLHTILEINEALNLANQGKLTDGYAVIEALLQRLQDSQSVKEEKYITDIMTDLKGQVLLALSKEEYYKKWGSHYFYSLMRAHILQQRNNFKDPGVQHYGGEIFEKLRDKIEEVFLTLPPPEATGMRDTYVSNYNVSSNSKSSSSNNNSVGQVPKMKNMKVFHNPSGGCFSGDSEVLMADGTIKLVQDIRKDDMILGEDFEPAKVLCVMKTIIPSKKLLMCKLPGGLKLTPWHPVRVEGKWDFPENIVPGVEMDCPEFYSYALDKGHIVRINGVECVTLGHNFKGDIVGHEFFGSEAVIKDLANLKGFDEGFVEITPDYLCRDPETKLINGIKCPINSR